MELAYRTYTSEQSVLSVSHFSDVPSATLRAWWGACSVAGKEMCFKESRDPGNRDIVATAFILLCLEEKRGQFAGLGRS